jgi:uncharacterized protein YbcC (UPF0753/DUF2309 family)
VTLFDEDGVPETHGAEIGRLRAWLAMAGTLARRSRPGSAEVDHASLERLAVERSQDWSQVRPEWGLAGCAAFIAAPRSRTGHRDLDGRAFLHCYDWRRDDGFAVLETILTAPMVVASWINLQYYASTVDNRRFGAGNKVLHNVAGGIGVFEGGGGDLRSGLPWQSLHDGQRLVHEPLRLTVVVEAPTEAIDAVLDRNDHVRDLVDNGWIHLIALNGDQARRRVRGCPQWTLEGG